MRIIKLLTVVPLVFLLSSCVGEEPNNIGYITALGIDKSGEEYSYTIQFANPTKISGGASEEGGSGGNIVENISVKAPTIYSAINNANAIISKDLSLAHAKIIVVSEDVAKEGLSHIANVIARNNDIRPDVYLAVAENAGEYLEEVKPVIELNPVKYYQLTYENKKGGVVPRNNAAEFFMACVSGDRDCVLPLAGVAGGEEMSADTDAGSGQGGEKEDEPTENKKNREAEIVPEGFQGQTRNYYAGQAGMKIKNKSETIGLAVFRGDTYVDKMGSVQAELYNILMGNIRDTKITFAYNEEQQQPVTVNIIEKQTPVFKIDKEKKRVEIEVRLETELLSAPRTLKEKADFDDYHSEMVSKACEEFLKKTYGEMNVDILGIKGKLKREFLTNSSYFEFTKNFQPKEWEIAVNTKTKMKRTGMTYYY